MSSISISGLFGVLVFYRRESENCRILLPLSCIFFRQITDFIMDLPFPKITQSQLWTKYLGLRKKPEICIQHLDILKVGHMLQHTVNTLLIGQRMYLWLYF